MFASRLLPGVAAIADTTAFHQGSGTTASLALGLEGTVAAGKYCVRLYDSGNIPASGSADYTVQIVHP